MLKFSINARNVDESNIFLRGLWCELNKIRPMGWMLYPYKKENCMIIGNSNLGEISYDYSIKGCIKNLYIKLRDEIEADKVQAAVRNALSRKLKPFSVCVTLNANKRIANQRWEDISILSVNDKNIITLNVFATSEEDLREIMRMNIWTIQAILFEYTFCYFQIDNILYSNTLTRSCVFEDTFYDYTWIDQPDMPINSDGEIIIPRECLILINKLFGNSSDIEKFELLFNSARMLLTSHQLESGIAFPHVPGISDIINSTMISSVEPLALFLDRQVRHCEKCGNAVYSIISKIKALFAKYVNEDFAKRYCNNFYKMRSSLFHSGVMASNFFKGEVSYPLINPTAPDKIMVPRNIVESNLSEYSSFLFRNIAHEYLCGLLTIIDENGVEVHL